MVLESCSKPRLVDAFVNLAADGVRTHDLHPDPQLIAVELVGHL